LIVVLCTVNTKETAKNIAVALIENKLAACVNIVPNISSVYSWNGNTVIDDEFLLIIKTQEYNYNKLEEKIKSIHPYELPEIISFNIDNGSKEYLDWLIANTRV